MPKYIDMSEAIDWDRVSKNLKCPKCGDKASISPGTDGYQGEHKHVFEISRGMAYNLSIPSQKELEDTIVDLTAKLASAKDLLERVKETRK